MSASPTAFTNNRSPWQRVGLETAGFIPAEFVSMGVSLGVVALADTVAPGLIKSASKCLSKVVFEPYLDYIEGGISKACHLETCKIDKTKSREERAEQLAKTTIIFSAAWAASMAAKMYIRRALNNLFDVTDPGRTADHSIKMTTHEKIIFGLDEGVHYGSLLLLNTAGAPITDEMIRATSGVLTKMGMSEQKAHEVASMAMIWELPNALGLAAGIAGIAGIHHKQWDTRLEKTLASWAKKPLGHVARLAKEEEALSHLTKS